MKSKLLQAGLASACISATLASAQSAPALRDAYGAAVRTYARTGDAVAALATIPGWSQAQFATAIKEVLAVGDSDTLMAAAVLHVDIALGIAAQSPATAADFLGTGEQLIAGLRARAHDPIGFVEKWYTAAASALLRVNARDQAAPLSARALETLPDSADLQLLAGIISELQAAQIDRSGAARASLRDVARRRWTNLIRDAESYYRRALAIDPACYPARVRLGRVLSLRGDVDAARQELERAEREADDPADRYLAALFIGALHDEAGNRTGAADAYERALAHRPASQAATVAAGYAALTGGRLERAQELAAALVSAPVTIDPWWLYQRGDLHRDAMAWLRAQVTR